MDPARPDTGADVPRRLLGPSSPEDTGAVAPAVAQALTAYAAGSAGRADVLAALLGDRLLVPVVAVLGEAEVGADGLAREKSSEMAAVLLTGADGRLALLAFTGTEAMRAWDPTARPVPVSTRTAAQSAVQEAAAAVVVDVAGPVPFVIEGDDLRATAHGWRLGRVGAGVVWIGAPDEETVDGPAD